MVMSCGTFWASEDVEKAGTGGRGGVTGGAFSLSVVCDSWLDMAFDVWGREGSSVVVGWVASAGGLGKSLTACPTSDVAREFRSEALPHPSGSGYIQVSLAILLCMGAH